MSVVPLSPQPASSAASEHDNTSVRVCLRVRPLLPYEQSVNAQKVLSYPNPNQLSLAHHNTSHAFTFDFVFDDFSSQSQVYAAAIQPLVDSFLAGYNTTILAYGQTGSGKTHTMGTAASADGMADDGSVGIIPRVIRDIFRCVHERETTHMHTVKVSFLEIYNEEIKDLLNTNSSAPQPYIREGPNNSILVANSIEEVVATAQDTVACLIRGSQCRVVGSTAMNATSSRSHAIFSIILSQRKLSPPQGDNVATTSTSTASPADAVLAAGGDDEVIQSKFHFVDLAGSERLKRTGAVGDRMKEGININQGLLALGNCISALGGEKKAGHVPFRDSKITRMLQDSLGGNSKTLMIACISPADVNADETVNTLKYANRAKNIKNKPIINRDPNSAKIEALRLRLAVLETAVSHYRAGNASEAEEALRSVDAVVAGGGTLTGAAQAAGGRGSLSGSGDGGGASAEELSLLRDQNLVLEAELKRLSDRMKGLRDEMSVMSDKLVVVETDRDVVRLKLEKARSGDVKEETADGDEPEVSVLAENRLTMQRMSKKIAHQKRQLDSAMKLINSYAIDGLPLLPTDSATPNAAGSGSARKKRRKNRRRTNPNTELAGGAGESGGLQQRVDEEAEEDESDVGEETDLSIVLADEQTLDDDDDADDGPSVDELDLSDADTADEQADTLALLAELKEKEHDAAMRQWTAEGVRLTADLTSKTKAVKDFQAQSANVLHMRVQYEKRITEMEREMEAIQQERDRVLKELEQSKSAEADKSEYERQYELAVKKYREQLSTLSSELKATREKLKENERMKRQLAMDEQRIKKLETDIAAAKKAKVSLAKKMEESAGKYREWCEMKDNKLKSMVKESRMQSILLKKMESEYAKQSIVLQRRNEEKAVLEKKIKVSQQQQQQQQQQHGGGGSGMKAMYSSRPNTSQQSSHRRSPPSNALRPPRATPARRPAGRRNRESPLARAKAMASNAAALSDSAAPNHPSSATTATSDELLKSAIEHEIAIAVERASRGREIEDWKVKLAGLQTQLLAVQDAMVNNPMQTVAQQSEYSRSEQQCGGIQSSLDSMEHTIRLKEAELARLMPPSASPLKGSKASTVTVTHPASSPKGKRGHQQDDESVFLSGSDIDYRMFSRIKVLSLDASKRALVYLIHQAVQNDVEKIEMRRELERLQRNAEDDRRHGEEKDRLLAQRRRVEAVMHSETFQLSPMQAQYDDLAGDGNQQLSPSARQRRISSPTPASPHSPSPATSFTYQPAPVYSPPLTNNFLSADEHNTTFIEIDHSGSATTLATHKPNALGMGAGVVAKKGANVFARLTDTSSFTGMYKSIAEEKRQKMPDINKPKKPVFQQPNKRHFDQLKGGSASQPLSTTNALLSWPPLTPAILSHSTSANSLSHSSTSTFPSSASSHPSSHSPSPALLSVDLQGKPAGSVFSRLTNPQLYTGAQRARFMDAQTKAHHRVTGDLDSSGRPARVASPPRTHSRQASSSDLPLSVTYDALSTPSLPTIVDGETAVHVVEPLDDSGSADDYQFVEDIRRGINLSLDAGRDAGTRQASDEQQHDTEAGLITPLEQEEVLSPTAPPVFHFSPAPGDDDKENYSQLHGSYNSNSNSNSGDSTPSSKRSFHVHPDTGDQLSVKAAAGVDGQSLDQSRPTHNYNLRSGSQGRTIEGAE